MLCLLVGCVLAVDVGCAWSVASPLETSEDARELGEALEAVDECRAGSSDSGQQSCGFSVVQLRGQRRSHLGTESGYEAAPAHKVGWMQSERCAGTELHELAFLVRPKSLAQLQEVALDRTNPSSPNYRKWLSRTEVSDLTRNEQGLLELRAHLRAHAPEAAILHASRDGDLLRVRAPVATWESLLSTEFFVYKHEEHNSIILRSNSYLLPGALKEHVSGVLQAINFEQFIPKTMPGIDLNNGSRDTQQPFVSAMSWDNFTELQASIGPSLVSPTKLRKIYNMPAVAERGSDLAKMQAKTSQVVFGTINQHWSPSDRTRFEEAFGIPQDNYVKQLKGQTEGFSMSGDAMCRENTDACDEANLDVQYMMAMSPWTQIGYWYVPEHGTATFLDDFVARLVDEDHPPQVISISYAISEFGVSPAASDLFEISAMKLTLQGTTIVVASGDDGAASSLVRNRQECMGLHVEWPASSKWVTSVGATVGPASGQPEVVCQSNYTGPSTDGEAPGITSGGGYSQKVPKPAWQEGIHNESSRGVPDLSLLGHNYAMVIGGRWHYVDGTSASAPVLGGMLSLINSELIAAGRPTIGFLNPLLYATSSKSIFSDVTEGDNRCASVGAPCCGGYDAGPGWDPVTGMGSIDWQKLRDAIMASHV